MPLRGDLEIPGSKNAALAILSAVLLSKGPIVLHNVPAISDVDTKVQLLRSFGAKITWHEGTLFIDCSELHDFVPDESTVRRIRTSFYLLGPLMARLGKAKLPMPGGCKIGARPVDYHLKGLHLMGGKIELLGGCYVAHVGQFHGAKVYLDFPSAGATQHLMATATLAKGSTVIENAAMEPEVIALAEFLNRMGARIEGAGTSCITIDGVSELGGCDFSVPADRIQAGTFLLAGAITCGDVTVRGILPEGQSALLNKLEEAGCDVWEGNDWVRVAASGRPKGIRVKTMPYPGFPTDIQQPISALLALAEGPSIIDETIYESRIGHISELNRMGAKIRIEGRATIIEGVSILRGAEVEASDLRAGAALCIAALAAQGESIIRNVHFIDRGYEDLEKMITSLGGQITRHEEEGEGKGNVAIREQIES